MASASLVAEIYGHILGCPSRPWRTLASQGSANPAVVALTWWQSWAS